MPKRKKDDRGGNNIRETGPCQNSLHTVWDTCIIQKKLGTDPQEVARDLLDGLPDSDRQAWTNPPVHVWATESLRITRRVSVGYCVQAGTKCIYQQGNEMFSEGEEEEVVKVDIAYIERHTPVIRDRLKRAGIRLGHLLNQALGQ